MVRRVLRRGGDVQQAHAFHPLTGRGFVPVAQHLDGSADGEHRGSPPGGALKSRMAQQMPGRQALRVVLGTAEGVEVQRVGHRVGQRDVNDLSGDSAHQQALTQHHRVAPVAVGSHHIGQNQADAHRHGRSFTWCLARARCKCRNAV